MKKDGITKLYNNLTGGELASLAIHYMANANELELERVADAVPRVTYKGPDLEYHDRVEGFFDLAAGWGLEYWKTYTRLLAARVSLNVVIGAGDREKVMVLVSAHQRWESRLLALDCVLADICEEHGISPDDVRRLVEADPYEPLLPESVADAEYQSELHANLSRLLEAWRLLGVHARIS